MSIEDFLFNPRQQEGEEEHESYSDERIVEASETVPDNWFDLSSRYLTVLGRLETLAERRMTLTGERKRYTAAELNSMIWNVIRSMAAWRPDQPIPEAGVLDKELIDRDIPEAGGLRAALVRCIRAECYEMQQDHMRAEQLREQLRNEQDAPERHEYYRKAFEENNPKNPE